METRGCWWCRSTGRSTGWGSSWAVGTQGQSIAQLGPMSQDRDRFIMYRIYSPPKKAWPSAERWAVSWVSEEGLLELEASGRADKVGSGEAVGFNVNVPLYSEDGLGDADYMQVGLITKAQPLVIREDGII